MLDDDDMLLGFLEEAKEHILTIEPDLLALEESPTDTDLLNRLFRSVHSIKGGAGFFGLDNMSSLAHVMENLMSKARNLKIEIKKNHIDALLKGLDRLSQMLDDVNNSNAIDINEELALLESLGVEAPSYETVEVSAKPSTITHHEPKEQGAEESDEESSFEEDSLSLQSKKFNIPKEEVEKAIQDGLNIYTVSVYLNRDITSQGKTPFQFISELEELGRFIDSYLDVDAANELEDCLEDDLCFIFAFATIMEPDIAAGVLEIKEEQFSLVNLEELDLEAFPEETSPADDDPQTANSTDTIMEEPEETAPEEESTEEPVAANDSEEKIEEEIEEDATPKSIAERESFVVNHPGEQRAAQNLPIPAAAQKEAETTEAKLPAAPPAPAGSTEGEGGAPIGQLKPMPMSRKNIKAEESIRVSIGKLNKLVDLAGELVLVRNQLLQASEKEGRKDPGFLSVLAGLNTVTTELQEEILNTRMQPISVIFGKFPRLIRELGASLGKEITLETEGNDVDLDKTVLEALSDPLTHIIRNTADHGIEYPAERKAKGKPVQGRLLLKAYHESGQVIILVEDDGKGIDSEVIARKALEKGLVTEEHLFKMSKREKINLIFMAGFSTAEQVSSVSGRGVGMDVVRSNVEQIGGTVELSSEVDHGTTIKMTLPLTMAIVSCLIVQSGKERFAIPQINLEELVMLKPDDYATMLGYIQEREVLKLRGELLPLISLSQGLSIQGNEVPLYKKLIAKLERGQLENKELSLSTQGYNLQEETDDFTTEDAIRILIVSVGINKVGIIVDSIVGSEEIVVKPMPEFLNHLNFFSGATILGDGTVAMILDTLGFIQTNRLSFTEHKSNAFQQENGKKAMEETQSLLIFDNGTEEQFAITVPLIQRVDEINLNQIQHVGNKEYIDYRGQQMRILRLADFLPIQQPEYETETLSIIIPKETRIPVGILINQVIDTKTLAIDLAQSSIQGMGVLGSTIIEGKITLLLDLYSLLEMGEPDSLHRVEFEETKVESSRILLIEDTPLFQNIVREYLKSVGFEVIVAENGKVGIETLEREPFDLVLCDIEMPVLDGFGVIRKIRSAEKWQDLPVIALTSLNDEDLIKRGIETGFNDWLVKLEKQKILQCIGKYI